MLSAVIARQKTTAQCCSSLSLLRTRGTYYSQIVCTPYQHLPYHSVPLRPITTTQHSRYCTDTTFARTQRQQILNGSSFGLHRQWEMLSQDSLEYVYASAGLSHLTVPSRTSYIALLEECGNCVVADQTRHLGSHGNAKQTAEAMDAKTQGTV
ncbi:hypothetical protein CPC08DRAFT_412248 [Agrocybe pediades]|nr:hypothetical protein CPC08DRAFT_412248 [Agrocybe pediades]